MVKGCEAAKKERGCRTICKLCGSECDWQSGDRYCWNECIRTRGREYVQAKRYASGPGEKEASLIM